MLSPTGKPDRTHLRAFASTRATDPNGRWAPAPLRFATQPRPADGADTSGYQLGSQGEQTRRVLRCLLPLLRCPWCEADGLRLRPGAEYHGDGERIITAILECAACPRVSKVTGEIWDARGPHRPQSTLAQLSNVIPPTPQLYERVWRRRSLTILSRRPFPLERELSEMAATLAPVFAARAPELIVDRPIILDIACSEGLYARRISREGDAIVVALDHSAPFLRRVLRHRDAESRNGRNSDIVAVRAIAQHLPFANGIASATAVGGSFNEIGDRQRAVNELARTSREGAAHFSMSLTGATRPLGKAIQTVLKPFGVTFPTEAETIAYFRNAGFTDLATSADGVVLRISARYPARRAQSASV